MVIERTREMDAFMATLDGTSPEAVSACDGWTTREIAAHVLGIAIEVVRHLEPYLQGDEVPKTRSFEEREAPLREAGHPTVLARLPEEDQRMRGLIADVLEREPEAVIPWTGRHMAVAKFVPHLRNECALHRWDVAGDDDTSRSLLGAQDLMEHSVAELGRILLVAGRTHDPDPDAQFRATLRAEGQPDLEVVVAADSARLVWAGAEPLTRARAIVEFDSAARHLFIWGRRPDLRGRVRSDAPQADLARVQQLLSGY
jgi:hypothetical protein